LGGSRGEAGNIIYQFRGNKFLIKKKNPFEEDAVYEDMASLFFDADGDGDDDLYVVSGSNEWEEGSEYYQDRLYINTDGNFKKDNSRIPEMKFSGSVVTGADYDKDGDIDLFIGGRQRPGMYPHPVSSVILRNDGGKFTDVTEQIAPDLNDIGMVSDALWTDYDSDGDRDLMIVGEWMPIRILRNDDGKFTNATYGAFDKETTGWWWSINSGDFDNDGDIDYVAGNLGLNYKYKASQEVPFIVYSDDFDHNGSNDIVLSYYEQGVCYPLRGRSCSSQQVPEIKKKFPTYNLFSEATVTDVYGEEKLEKALEYKAHHFASSYFENNGDGTFKVIELPQLAQISTMFGLAPYVNDRIIDLSYKAANEIGDLGLPMVQAEYVSKFANVDKSSHLIGFSETNPIKIFDKSNIEILSKLDNFNEAMTVYKKISEESNINNVYILVGASSKYYKSNEYFVGKVKTDVLFASK
jgi:hypothetical protein